MKPSSRFHKHSLILKPRWGPKLCTRICSGENVHILWVWHVDSTKWFCIHGSTCVGEIWYTCATFQDQFREALRQTQQEVCRLSFPDITLCGWQGMLKLWFGKSSVVCFTVCLKVTTGSTNLHIWRDCWGVWFKYDYRKWLNCTTPPPANWNFQFSSV